MNKLIIIYTRYSDENGDISIGGIQSYISLLVETFSQRFDVFVYHPFHKAFELDKGHYRIKGVKTNRVAGLINYLEEKILEQGDILLIASEQIGSKTTWRPSIVIQHGIYWDLSPIVYSKSWLADRWPFAYKLYDNWRNLRRLSYNDNVVCVDYNYLNWYRILIDQRKTNKNFWIIPNCCPNRFFDVYSLPDSDSNVLRILFARRLVRLRGTVLFAELAKSIIEKYSNVKISVVGDGPDELRMRQILPESEKVSYSKMPYNIIHEVIGQHDLVVIPSLGSEGTSLIAIEAMAAGKPVIATNVGGLTNLIIDGYNGILCHPTKDSLYESIKRIIEDPYERKRIGRNARAVAKESFTYKIWSQRWHRVIDDILA